MTSQQGSVKQLRSQRSEVIEARDHTLTWVDLWALGITIVIGGQYFSWNLGVWTGIGTFGIATFFVATGYICLIFCIAELSSALPFAGFIFT
jgi:amino acid transporter